jgi:glycosyltransferase involved in cell wall biosynthesis
VSGAPLGLTIGIATRDRPGSLARLLASLAPLVRDIDRVIVVDDGSSADASPALAAADPELSPRVTLVQPGAIGMAAARNRVGDPGGFSRLAREVAALLLAAWRERTPVRLRTRWREIGRTPPPYPGPESGGGG